MARQLAVECKFSECCAASQAEAAQAAERARKAREEADSVRVAAAVADARAEAELLERQRAHGEQVDDLSRRLEVLRSAGKFSLPLASL